MESQLCEDTLLQIPMQMAELIVAVPENYDRDLRLNLWYRDFTIFEIPVLVYLLEINSYVKQ